MTTSLVRLFSLRRDQQDTALIDDALRQGAGAAGTNLWVLFFAILIASVGLNVNSTAVIIGAMLISPLMGPIVGLGYAAAIADFELLRTAGRNLLVFTALSLVTSVLYFAISPLDQPQSELLARTSPTLWDVLIAAFGGAAGMVAVTRKSFSNIVPGVAIATALMPPLCTAGFGLAHGRWDMFAGAFYLFLINGVFIAAATMAISKLLRLPAITEVDFDTRRRHRAAITAGLLLVLVPSIWLGYQFVQNEVFANAAGKVGRSMLADSRVLSYDIDAPQRTLVLTALGPGGQGELETRAQALLSREGVEHADVAVRRAGGPALDVTALRRDLAADLTRTLSVQVQANSERLQAIESRLGAPGGQPDLAGVTAEIRALWPQVREAYLAQPLASLTAAAAVSAAPTAAAREGRTLVVVDVDRALGAPDRARLTAWLAVRLGRDDVVLVEEVVRAAPRR